MIQISVNDEPLEFTVEQEKTIGELLGEVETFCNKNGHAVFKIIVDDAEMTAEQLDELFAKSVSGTENIRLFTASGTDIKMHILELGLQLQQDAKDLQDVSVKMQTGDDSSVIALLEKISMRIKKLLEFLSLETISQIGADTELYGSTIIAEQKKITDFLKEIAQAFAEKDIITVSDLCEYELSPLLKNLGEGLASL